MAKRNNKEYKLVVEKPVARFFYKGHHSHPIRRTVLIIEDNENSIINTINEVKNNFKYIFTTGGIGPTHDDITSESIAKAFNKKYEFHSEAFNILKKYYPEGQGDPSPYQNPQCQ